MILVPLVVGASGSEYGWEVGGLLLLAGAVAVLVVPRLRRTGAGFLLGIALGSVAQFALVAWALSTLS